MNEKEEKDEQKDYLSQVTSLAHRNPDKKKFQEYSNIRPDFSSIELKILSHIEPFLKDTKDKSNNNTYKTDYIMKLFNEWYNLVLECTPFIINPNGMCLSTIQQTISQSNINNNGATNNKNNIEIIPDSRYVVCKEINNKTGDFIFYTNYNSNKSQQIKKNQNVSLLFYWDCVSTQVRIQGNVIQLPTMLLSNSQEKKQEKEEKEKEMEKKIQQRFELLSDNYWTKRPFKSKISALASNQSHIIANKEILESKYKEIENEYGIKQDNLSKEELNKIDVKRPQN